MQRLLILLALLFLCNSYAVINYRSTIVCTGNAAYAAGLYDSKNGYTADNNYARFCPVITRTQISSAYQRGFQSVQTSNRVNPSRWICVRGNGAGKICGYDCKTSAGVARCAKFSGQQCVVGNLGNIVCGWSCVKSAKAVKCAQAAGENCIADNFGNIQCGTNCRIEFGKIKCAAERTEFAPLSSRAQARDPIGQ